MPPSTAVVTVEPSTALAPARSSAIAELEKVVLQGNLKGLSDGERIAYYARVCESLGLNPLTRPFEYIELQGKLTLYARKDATDQLRQLHGVNIVNLERERTDDLQIVTCTVRDRYGREDSAIGAVSIKGLGGEALANALMKAETKAKRRATLSVCGLGWMDEVEAMDARRVEVAPREALTSGIASRTAALIAAAGEASEPGESEAVVPDGGAEAEGVLSPSAGSPDEPTPVAPRARRKPADRKPLEQGDAGYGTARAHAVADERGMDHAAVHRIAADVLGVAEDDLAAFSVSKLTEDQWMDVVAAISAAPVADGEAETFAGQQALIAGMGEGDNPWPVAEPAIVEMFGVDLKDITPVHWREFGIRVAARNPLP